MAYKSYATIERNAKCHVLKYATLIERTVEDWLRVHELSIVLASSKM